MFTLPESLIEDIANAAIKIQRHMHIENNSRRVTFENLHQTVQISF